MICQRHISNAVNPVTQTIFAMAFTASALDFGERRRRRYTQHLQPEKSKGWQAGVFTRRAPFVSVVEGAGLFPACNRDIAVQRIRASSLLRVRCEGRTSVRRGRGRTSRPANSATIIPARYPTERAKHTS